MIILAAGQGTRLKPLTNDRPKCMVEYGGKLIIDYILQAASECKIENIIIINGYKKEVLENHLKDKNINFYFNKDFEATNMLYTLFCAEKEMDDDIIISYADIIYKKEVLQSLINCDYDFSVVVDKEWEKLWRIRMENPLDDAETLKIGPHKNIIELGKKAKNYKDIQGQYIGLIKISKNIINQVKNIYHNMNTDILYDGKKFKNMYMTSFIQHLIGLSIVINPCWIHGGWFEIDSIEDLHNYQRVNFKI